MDDPANVSPFTLQVTGQFPPPSVASIAHRVFSLGNGYLDIVTSTLSLMYVALGQPSRSLPIIRDRFSSFIANAKRDYDLVILDCHPAGSVFTQTSLSASDHVVIPVKPQNFAVRGLGLMKQFIEGRGPQSPAIRSHILFNQTEATRSTEEAQIRSHPQFGPICMRNSVRSWKHLSLPNEGRNFVWNRPVRYQPEAMSNIRQTFTELMGRIY
jgi:chromosome partitioning protein